MKLIGVRINQTETLPEVKKILAEEWYPFFDVYRLKEHISNLSDEEFLDKISCINKADKNFCERLLYTPDKENGPIISVHAIVGKNGYGKSTLLEIVLRLINNLACLTIGDEKRNESPDFCWAEGISATLFFSITDENSFDKCCYLSCLPEKIVVIKDETGYKFDSSENCAKLKVLDNYRIPLEHLFYSIMVNYSHYSLNTKEVYGIVKDKYFAEQLVDDAGRKLYYAHEISASFVRRKHWLNRLFHKNDGYLTPIVTNPLKIDGNIDINKEISLSKTRLIGILCMNPNFLSGYTAINLRVSFPIDKTINKFKDQEYVWERTYYKNGKGFYSKKYKDALLNIYYLWCNKFKVKFENKDGNPYFYYVSSAKDLSHTLSFEMTSIESQIHTCLLYLAYKSISISSKYDDYSIRSAGTLQKVVDKIYQTHTPITLKVHQTIYHLRNRLLSEENQSDWEEVTHAISLKIQNLNIDEIIKRLYPPIYDVDVELKRSDDTRVVTLATMSSGERQMLYSMSSIFYHLLNLKSIKEDKSHIKYRNVNILLDEVEMYYHPEYQRQFLAILLELIDRLNLNKTDIYSINICIVTHSPFLLSDILRRNILFMEDGNVVNDNVKGETFGANVYDILRNGFFLKENALGCFVNEKIKSVLEYINNPEGMNIKREEAQELINFIGDPLIKGYLSLNMK